MARALRMAYQDLDVDVDSDSTGPASPHTPTSNDVSERSLSSSISSLDENEVQEISGADAQAFIEHVLKLHRDLETLPDLAPRPIVNRLFNDLVSACLDPDHESFASAVLEDPRLQVIVPRLRTICSQGECELERYWAGRIGDDIKGRDLASDLDQAFGLFPYYSNYQRITAIESALVRAALPPSRTVNNIAFIGSGPLPLTPFLLAQTHFTSANIINIDCDLHALKLSNILASRLGLDKRIKKFHGKADKIPAGLLIQCDVVYLAALVGMSSSAKRSILSSVAAKMKEGAILLARSSYGLRSLLYPVLTIDTVNVRKLGLELVTEWRPEDDEVVNSVVVFRKASVSWC